MQHNTHQTLNVDLGRLAEDLSAIRKALLLAEAAENEDDVDAAEEAVKVGRAQKAIKAGEQSGIISVLKTFGTKTWALGERLALAYVLQTSGSTRTPARQTVRHPLQRLSMAAGWGRKIDACGGLSGPRRVLALLSGTRQTAE